MISFPTIEKFLQQIYLIKNKIIKRINKAAEGIKQS